MAKYSKIEVIAAMKETGMVPVFYSGDVEIAKQVLYVPLSSPTVAILPMKFSVSW